MTLTCSKCWHVGVPDDFPKNRSRKTGRGELCRRCNSSRCLAYSKRTKPWKKPRYREVAAARSRERRANPATAEAERDKSRRHKRRNPKKGRVQHQVANAIKHGRLTPMPCEVCGATAEAHHDDYSRPLDVRWLCHLHHCEWHEHHGEGANAHDTEAFKRPPSVTSQPRPCVICGKDFYLKKKSLKAPALTCGARACWSALISVKHHGTSFEEARARFLARSEPE